MLRTYVGAPLLMFQAVSRLNTCCLLLFVPPVMTAIMRWLAAAAAAVSEHYCQGRRRGLYCNGCACVYSSGVIWPSLTPVL